MDLIHAIKTDADILPLVDKTHQLLYRTVELSDDILDREHHTQGQAAIDDSRSR